MTTAGWLAIGAAGIGAWWLFSRNGSGGSEEGSPSSLSNSRQTSSTAGKDISRQVPVDRTKTSYVSPTGKVTYTPAAVVDTNKVYTEAHQNDVASVPPGNTGGRAIIPPSLTDLVGKANQLGIPQGAFTASDPSQYYYWKRVQVNGLWTNQKETLTPEMVSIVNQLKSLGYTTSTIGSL